VSTRVKFWIALALLFAALYLWDEFLTDVRP
jgi:hypothetical protein